MKLNYFVYSGSVNADNCDTSDGPIFTLEEYKTAEEVLDAYESFIDGKRDDDAHSTFQVFFGERISIIPKEKVITYELSRPEH